MGNELAVVKQDRLTGAVEFNNVQLQLLKDTTAAGCDDNEFMLFIELAKAKRLNPFDGQIRPIKRWDSDLGRNKMTVQTGIDGLRCIAARTGEHAGTDDAVYDSEGEDRPKWAKVTVYRYVKNGDRNPFTATARWSEYVGKKKGGEPNSMWTGKPYIMLGKCAEALALRKAFPDEMSGLYTNEEMAQADNNLPPSSGKPPVEMPQSTEAKVPGIVEFTNAVIRSRKDGKEDTLWLDTTACVAVVSANTAAKFPFNVGDSFSFKAKEKQGKEIKYYLVQEVNDYSTVQEQEDPLPPMEDGPAPAREKDSMDEAIEEGVFDQKEPAGTSQELVGKKRQVRLWTLMSTNKQKTGLTNDIVHEILDAMEPPVKHLEDLGMGMYPMFERIMKGEEDWKPLHPKY